MKKIPAQLVFEDGTSFQGDQFGAGVSASGEVVFNTGMVGYPETMTDPSYRGQILVLTYPLIGNYGIPVNGSGTERVQPDDIVPFFESKHIQVQGLVVSSLAAAYSHWSALDSLHAWMERNNVPGLTGVDTRAITKHLRVHGSMPGKIVVNNDDVPFEDPNVRNLVSEVSVPGKAEYRGGDKGHVALVDFGAKNNILRRLLSHGLNVTRVPWNYDWSNDDIDGVVLSNGPGDPKTCGEASAIIRKGIAKNIPTLGICLGHQLLAIAAGADTFKMKFGHRSQNQPCIQVGTKRCYITSQNHGYAVSEQSLGGDWIPWFFNANDGTNEGLRHVKQPLFSVQFHPEATPGPTDTDFIFNSFVQSLKHGR